jgi:hypothetical protein
MMSSETSTESGALSTLRPWQLFVFSAILAATAAVLLSRGAEPRQIILVSIVVLSSSTVAIAVYRMLWPLVSADGGKLPEMVGSRTRRALEREKTLVLRSIKELEFDRAMGKVSPADFDEMVGRLRSRAVGLISQLDRGDAGYEQLIERELIAKLGPPPVRQESHVAAPDEATAAPEHARAVRALQCRRCGTLNDVDAHFCKSCGQRFEA